MPLIIEDQDLQAAGLSEEALRLEIALLLYQQARFSMGRASRFAGMNRIAFQEEMGKRKIAVNYDAAEFAKDLRVLGFSFDT